jgi:hypothetical protein
MPDAQIKIGITCPAIKANAMIKKAKRDSGNYSNNHLASVLSACGLDLLQVYGCTQTESGLESRLFWWLLMRRQ